MQTVSAKRRVYYTDEVAAMLGCTTRAVTDHVHRGTFPSHDLKIGRRPAWLIETVDQFFSRPADASRSGKAA